MFHQFARLFAIVTIFMVAILSAEGAAAWVQIPCEDQWMGCFEECEDNIGCEVGPCEGLVECIACSEGGGRGKICRMNPE